MKRIPSGLGVGVYELNIKTDLWNVAHIYIKGRRIFATHLSVSATEYCVQETNWHLFHSSGCSLHSLQVDAY